MKIKYCRYCGNNLSRCGYAKVNMQGKRGLSPYLTYCYGAPFVLFMIICAFGVHFFSSSTLLLFITGFIGLGFWFIPIYSQKPLYFCKACNKLFATNRLKLVNEKDDYWILDKRFLG